MFLIIESTEEDICSISKTHDLKKAENYMLRKIIEACIDEYGTEDFCEEYAAVNDPHYDDDDYEVEFFETFDELQDAGLINDFCEFLSYEWNIEIKEDRCLLDYDDDSFYAIRIIDTDNVELLDFVKS